MCFDFVNKILRSGSQIKLIAKFVFVEFFSSFCLDVIIMFAGFDFKNEIGLDLV